MKLPDAEQGVVAREKIADYLLSESNVRGRDKNRFFRSFGFHPDRWPELAAALRRQGASGEVSRIVETPHGPRYYVEGSIETPDGRHPRIRTVWQFDRGCDYPRLITAHPLPR